MEADGSGEFDAIYIYTRVRFAITIRGLFFSLYRYLKLDLRKLNRG